MRFRYISVFLKLMFHLQYTRHHRTAVQDCHIPEFGFGLHLHKLQDIRQLPNQSHQFATRPNHHELRKNNLRTVIYMLTIQITVLYVK